MYLEDLKDLVWMSRTAGERPDYVQAGGGNTSVKFTDGYMAIKASGYLLRDMTENHGFAAVDGAAMKAYHEIEHPADLDCNKDSMDKAIASIKSVNGESAARPSVEVGFHSIFDKFVLHLHPVYTNVLMCSKDAGAKTDMVFKDSGISYICVPYVMPGYPLTKLIQEKAGDFEKQHGKPPQVIFLINHGVITTAPTASEAFDLMVQVNDTIKERLHLEDFPAISVKNSEGGFISENAWLLDALNDQGIKNACKYDAMFPDQLVYLCNDITFDSDPDKRIMIDGGRIFYRGGEDQAASLEESLTATVYVIKSIMSLGWERNMLTDQDCMNILGWDSEKYRKSLMEGK